MFQPLRLGFLNPISTEWAASYQDRIMLESRVEAADFIIYESNGDPIHMIMKIREAFPLKKLVFILSGDQSFQIDDECIWFTNAVRSSGLARHQTQIFVTNPAIFKYYARVGHGTAQIRKRHIDIYFKGTIWSGMREAMYNYFSNTASHSHSHPPEMTCLIEKNNDYWGWRLNVKKPKQAEIEAEAFKTYTVMENSLLCLCPKGNGNSSMRIVEALACGAIPVLIDDFSAPFGVSWVDAGVAIAFDTRVHSWDFIYAECNKLVHDKEKLEKMQKKGQQYFNDVIYRDATSATTGFKMYENLDTVAFGFGGLILDRLMEIKSKPKSRK